MFFTNFFYSQNGNIALNWDIEVGCQIYSEEEIKRIPLEDIVFGECINVCEYSKISYQLTGETASISYIQLFVNGGELLTDNNDLSPNVIQWGEFGFGTIQINIYYQDGTEVVKTLCINKIYSPIAQFSILGFGVIDSGDVPSICQNQELSFIDFSSNNSGSNIVSYEWDFGDGNYSNAQNPIHSYTTDGLKTVALKVTSSCNCSSITKKEIRIRKPGIVISCPSMACENQIATYTVPLNFGCTIQPFWWSVEGGTILSYSANATQIEVMWDNVDETGFGVVTFNNTPCNNGCTSINTVRIPVVKTSGTIVGETNICAGLQHRYKLPQWPTTEFNWSLLQNDPLASLVLTDQRNEIIINALIPGEVTLVCDYNNTLLNCGGQAILKIIINPAVYINGNSTACENSSQIYTLMDCNGLTFNGEWILTGPDTNQIEISDSFTANFENPGTYLLTVISENSCTPKPLIINVSTKPSAPEGISGPSPACSGTPIIYSVTNPLSNVNYQWSVIGGTIQGSTTGNSVTIQFSSLATTFQVNVVAKQKNHPFCESLPFTLNINKLTPVFQIVGEQIVCASTNQTYSTSYLEADNYFWDIIPSSAGSVTSGNGTNQITVLWNNYNEAIIPQVRLRIRKCNSQFTDTHPIQIIFSPDITITAPTTICRGEAFTATINSMPVLTSIDHIDWDFGDGTTYTVTPDSTGNFALNASHTYLVINPINTEFTISAVIYGANGCVYPATAIHSIQLIPSPKANITPAQTILACLKSQINVTYTVNIQTGFGNTTLIEWYRNGVLIPAATNQVNFSPVDFGTYHTKVYNDFGCSTITNSNLVRKVCLDECPITAIMPEINGTQTACTNYDASVSFIPSPTPNIIQWNITGGANFIAQNDTSCSINFNNPGYFILYYEAEITQGSETCSFKNSKDIIIPFKADLRYTINCRTDNTYDINLLYHSVILPGYEVENYKFNIDGVWYDNLTVQNYATTIAPGIHTIGIRISRAGFPSCEYTTTIDLPNYPDGQFSYLSTTCYDNPIQFTVTNPQEGDTYLWSFGDNSTNFQQNPIKVFTNNDFGDDAFNISLTVTNRVGCSTSFSYPGSEIVVYGVKVDGELESAPLSGIVCQGEPISINYVLNSGTQTPVTYEWYSEDTLITTTTLPSFNPTISGTYWAKVVDTNGCKTIISGKSVTIIPAPAAVINGPTSACVNSYFNLDGNVCGNATYSWSLNGTIIETIGQITTVQAVAGTYNYQLQVSVPNGSSGFCYNTTSHTIQILEVQEPPTITIDSSSVHCNPFSVSLTAFSSEPGAYNWSNGASGNTITVTNGGPFSVRFTNEAGCTSIAEIDIPKPASFYSWIVPRGCYTLCRDQVIGSLIGPIIPFSDWQWFSHEIIVDSGTNTTVANLAVNEVGTYQLGLATSLCPLEFTEPFNVSLVNDCKACPVNILVDSVVPIIEDGLLFYTVTLQFQNSLLTPLQGTLNNLSGGGVFVPSVVNLSGGTTTLTFIFIPPFGFVNGELNFYFSSNHDDEPCNVPFSLEILNNEKLANRNLKNNFLIAAPNPAHEFTTFYYNYDIEVVDQKILITDIAGRTIKEVDCFKKNNAIKIDCSDFPSGIYLASLMVNGSSVQQTKFVKQ